MIHRPQFQIVVAVPIHFSMLILHQQNGRNAAVPLGRESIFALMDEVKVQWETKVGPLKDRYMWST